MENGALKVTVLLELLPNYCRSEILCRSAEKDIKLGKCKDGRRNDHSCSKKFELTDSKAVSSSSIRKKTF